MTSTIRKTPAKRRVRAPKIIIDAEQLDQIERLATGAMQRNPDLSDRLLSELARARVVAPAKMPPTVVAIGSRVTYRDEMSGQDNVVILVYPKDADIARQRVSVMTPVGVALLGLSQGDTFHWQTRDDQRRTLTVLTVEPPDEGTDSAG